MKGEAEVPQAKIPGWIFWLLLLLAVARQLWIADTVGGINVDQAIQIAGAKSLAAGQGYVVRYANDQDLSQSNTVWINQFPPGFSVLFATVQATKIFPDDEAVNACLYGLTALLLYLAYGHLVSKFSLISDSRYLLFFLAFWVVGQPPFSHLSTVDLLALAFYAWAIYHTLSTVQRGDGSRWAVVKIATFTLGCVSMRFAFWPLCVIPPLVLTFLGVRFNPAFRRSGAGVFLVTMLGAGTLVLLNKANSGHATFLTAYYGSSGAGTLHWTNLLLMNLEFPQVPFGLPELWSYLEAHSLGSLVQSGRAFFTCLILFCLAVTATNRVVRPLLAGERLEDAHKRVLCSFWLIGVLTVLVTVGMLCVLSVKTPAYRIPNYSETWTYVGELRYFAPCWFFFFLAVWDRATAARPGVSRLALRVGLGFIFLFATLAHLKGIAARLSSDVVPRPSDDSVIRARLADLCQSGKRVVYATNHFTNAYYLSDAIPVPTGVWNTAQAELSSTAPVTILFAAWESSNLRSGEGPQQAVIESARKRGAHQIFESKSVVLWVVHDWLPQ